MPISTAFQKFPYTIAGDSFISSAKDLSTQYTKNMYVVPAPNSLTDTAALYSFPGLKVWSSGASGELDRGIHSRLFQGYGYKVSGTTLYRFDSVGTQTSIGTIDGSGLVSMADNGAVLIIVANGTAYSYDGTTLSTLSLSFSSVQIDYLNNQFLILDNSNTVNVSNVGTTTFVAGNSFQAESSPDGLKAIKVFNQFVFNFGDKDSIEPWENTGQGTPPFERMNGAIIEDVGLANKNCVVSTPSALYFLSNDKIPYRVVNFQSERLIDGNPGVAELFKGYDVDSAFAQSLVLTGQDIILFFFPADEKCWGYSENVGLWFELDYDVDAKFYKGKSIAYLFDRWLVGDRDNGDIYELDSATYQNNSITMVRERVFRPFSGETIGANRANLQMKLMQFAVETGVGVSDDNPQMIVSFSFDGGRSYGSERWLSIGEEGDYIKTVETYSNKKFKDLVCKVRYTENTRFSLYDAAIYAREAGR